VRWFPAPWHTVRYSECFIIKDATSNPVAYVYFAEGTRLNAMQNWLREDEARHIAKGIAGLPELIDQCRKAAQDDIT
jgi:hypothetical protein